MTKICVVVPSIREDCWREFRESWDVLFSEHDCDVIRVVDGDVPTARLERKARTKTLKPTGTRWTAENCRLGDLIHNFTPACRNLGFYVAGKILNADIIITLDDDCLPDDNHPDPIYMHIRALNQRVSLNWFETANIRMRGFPLSEWRQSPVMVSHGCWSGVPDLDAPSQLVLGETPEFQINKGAVPRGVMLPFCGMNVAFRKEALPFMYYAPVSQFEGCQRFDDIWCGLYLKQELDARNWGLVSGYSIVEHKRASNVFKNLKQEVVGLKINEDLWKDIRDELEDFNDPPAGGFFKMYKDKRNRWKDLFV